ncbi:CMP-N-acetylneuraminate-beta-galactosamide-alpha-2,3-sialyltransferase 1-like [Xiphophorus hellerii]|uniref:CMP-N-acetylneuraminate-beta-galactosamide- alpha-2,3-sialyltransferase 1-like n=1 Tax=Xiphophorus hellerii TaxID=8084 RepID=UPI0013B368D9|nr:CMP-N-acetylneuraminate-beta-galactosamide-alpha-2,3-sialyltransferase 1-like [Xiphophorus hellerii]
MLVRWKSFSSNKANSSKMNEWKTTVFLLCAAAVGLLLKAHFNNWPSLKDRNLSWRELETELSDVNALLGHHLRRSVEPFLSANISLSEETFNWWKQLQREKHDLNCYKSTVQKLFEIFPPTSKADPVRYRTCAVVGNSVNLRGAAYGQLIDFHEVIIRMNGAPIQGHEEDVGVKTTHHVMYPESAVDLNNSTHLVLFPFKIQDLQWLIKAFTTGFNGK